jgi:hypothetical protein
MRNGWVKHFNDGFSETGWDDDVRSHKASWRHGRLDDLVAVSLHHDSLIVTLSAFEGNWWQSDTMVSRFNGHGNVGQTSFLVRRLEYQIREQDVGKFVFSIIKDNDTAIRVSRWLPIADNTEKETIRLGPLHVGKWLFVTLDAQSHKVTTSFHDQKK